LQQIFAEIIYVGVKQPLDANLHNHSSFIMSVSLSVMNL